MTLATFLGPRSILSGLRPFMSHVSPNMPRMEPGSQICGVWPALCGGLRRSRSAYGLAGDLGLATYTFRLCPRSADRRHMIWTQQHTFQDCTHTLPGVLPHAGPPKAYRFDPHSVGRSTVCWSPRRHILTMGRATSSTEATIRFYQFKNEALRFSSHAWLRSRRHHGNLMAATSQGGEQSTSEFRAC